MDREKEIKEIAAIINQALSDMAYPFAQGAAYLIVKAGYHKPADDDIVLTKGGMDDRTLEFFKKHNEKVRKETAKEILQWLYDLCKGNFSLNASEVRQIAKDHGVEVDE